MDIVEFLRARLNEDEEIARSAIPPHRPGATWQWVTNSSDTAIPPSQAAEMVLQESISLRSVEEFPTLNLGPLPAFLIRSVDEVESGPADHIARHDPARVLREVEAKRQIVELHESWPVLVETEPEFSTTNDDTGNVTAKMSKRIAWLTNREYRQRFGDEPPTSPILRMLALPYADHPDYDETWRP